LVINYGFENEPSLKRDANKADLENLRKTFSAYKKCIYKEIASPKNTEVAEILNTEGTFLCNDGKQLFMISTYNSKFK